jgi:hypothetical protein
MIPEQPLPLKEFFKQELETLHVKTGFRQLENMMKSEGWEKDVTDLINFMIEECNKPPFNIVRTAVKQRVIARAIVEDQEFTGLNAKFVRKALNAWWTVNGDRVIEATNANPGVKPVELTPEQDAKVNKLINEYVGQLLSGDGPQMIKKIEPSVLAKQGKEWTSNIERKAVSTTPDPERQVYTAETIKERNERIRVMQEKTFRERNPNASDEEVKLFLEDMKKFEVKTGK